jgi:protein-tyrosine phosphatase
MVTVAKKRALEIKRSHIKLSKIIEGLYLCGERAINESNIKQYNIKANVDLSKLRVVERKIKNNQDIKCLIIDVNDDPKQAAVLKRHCPRIFQFISYHLKKNNNVVVNCQAGISRSATVIIGYLMHTKKMSYDKAFNYVRRRRPIVNPNKGFSNMLKYTITEKLSSSTTTSLATTAKIRDVKTK